MKNKLEKEMKKVVMSIDFKPSERTLNAVMDIFTFVDLAIINDDLSPNGNGFIKKQSNDFIVWQWAIVKIGSNFQFPVPIIQDADGNVKLYDFQSKHVIFSKEEAALVLCKYYLQQFLFIISTTGALLKIPFLGYALNRATNWMNNLGGGSNLLNYLSKIDEVLMSDQEAYSKSQVVLD